MQVPGNLAKLPVTFDPMLGMTYAEALSLQETRGFEFFFFSSLGKDGFYPRLRHLWAVRVAAGMLMNDSQAEDVKLIKEAGMSRGI